MKIKDLIKVFEQLLPIYKKGLLDGCIPFGLSCGICFASDRYTNFSLYPVFIKGYYKKLVNVDGLLFPYPLTAKDLKSRIDFMESEIKDLKRLLKKGYTHV